MGTRFMRCIILAPMFGRLLPKEGRFFDLFNAHAEQIVRAAHELMAVMEDFPHREEHARLVDEAEHAADRITADTIRLLHTTFITPIDRDHIHQLVNAMDDICDLIQDATETLTLYDIRNITPEAARLADIGLKCCERVKDIVHQLGVRGHKFETIVKTCEEIDRLESDADRVLRAAVSRLFREEQDVREIIKMKAIYELLEAVTDRCLDVANLAEGISLENT
jgi:predicted phosphate transport protein (TIGR00153 family)